MKQILDDNVNEGGKLVPEGWHHAEVYECKEKRSARGDGYYNLELVDARTKDLIAYDVCMLEGKGNGIGIKKLSTLGAASRNETGNGWIVQPCEQVVGMRAYVYVQHEQYEWEGQQRTRCKVPIDHGTVGYRSDGDVPEEGLAGSSEPEDDVPF